MSSPCHIRGNESTAGLRGLCSLTSKLMSSTTMLGRQPPIHFLNILLSLLHWAYSDIKEREKRQEQKLHRWFSFQSLFSQSVCNVRCVHRFPNLSCVHRVRIDKSLVQRPSHRAWCEGTHQSREGFFKGNLNPKTQRFFIRKWWRLGRSHDSLFKAARGIQAD